MCLEVVPCLFSVLIARAHAHVWDVGARYCWMVASALGENRLEVPETFGFAWVAFELSIGRMVVFVRCGSRPRASRRIQQGHPILGCVAASPGSRGRSHCI